MTRSMSFNFIVGLVTHKALKSGSRGKLGKTCRAGSLKYTPASGLTFFGAVAGFQTDGEPIIMSTSVQKGSLSPTWHHDRFEPFLKYIVGR